MHDMKILIPIHVMPTQTHITTIMMKNLLPILKTKTGVEVFWFVYSVSANKEKIDGQTILDYRDFSSALDVINKIKPNLLILNSDKSSVDLSFEIAAYFTKTKVLCPILSYGINEIKFNIFTKIFRSWVILKLVMNSFSSFMNTDSHHNRWKISFLKTTMNHTSLSIKQKFQVYWGLFLSLINSKPFYYNKNNFYSIENEKTKIELIKKNFNQSNIFVVGNPLYDNIINKLNELPVSKKTKVNVLFAPTQVYEDGIWNKKETEESIRQIIIELKKNSNFDLTVKIHPTSSNKQLYESVIHTIDNSIEVHNEGDFIDYLANVDVVISFPARSTMFNFVFISNKPLILCNFFNKKQLTLPSDIIIECTSSKLLNKLILDSISQKKDFSTFIKKNFFQIDGRASERLSEIILLMK